MNKDNIVLLRVDGHYQVGMGHLVRCIAIANALKRRRIKPLFLIKDYKIARDILDKNRMDYAYLNKKSCIKKEINFLNQQTERFSARTFIIDIKSISSSYAAIENLKKKNIFIVHIDDFERLRGSKVDLVIAAESEKNINKNNTLRGFKYVILEKNFNKYNQNNKKLKRAIRNIVLSFGSGDKGNVFAKVIAALEKCGYDEKITLIVGPTFKSYNLLRKVLNKSNLDIRLVKNAKDMAKLLHKADFAFLSGGLTKYQASCVGTPAFIIAQDKAQLRATERFARHHKSVLCLGENRDLTIRKIQNMFEKASKSWKQLIKMSKDGQRAIDGLGADRIAERILSLRK